jgi:murein DD-endopeptidase MepM/ murein hydrolase activator NlpD
LRKGTPWGIPRLATHGWALALALLVLALAPLGFRHPIADAQATVISSGLGDQTGIADPMLRSPSSPAQARQLTPLVHYRVTRRDSVQSIAARAGITVDTLVQINRLPSPPVLDPGQRLIVPPIDGTMIRVDQDQRLDVLAQTFRVDVSALRAVNGLAIDARLPKELFIPAMRTEDIAQAAGSADAAGTSSNPAGTREQLIRFAWPAKGIITQYFSEFHPGIDIANDVGTPELAADAGRVVFAGWGDYGIYVEIDHGNGFHTVYGHLSRANVSTGQVVTKGQLIGLMGATGRATGPHLHFEIRYQGVPQNPIDLLS